MLYDSKSDDYKDRLVCAAWNGSRTPGFRKFKRDFQAATDAVFLTEDDFSIWSACNDLDQGGQGPNADPMPGANVAGHLNAVRRRKRRQAKAYQYVYAHIDNERIKELLAMMTAT